MQRVRLGCPGPSVLSSAWFFSKIQNIVAGPSQKWPIPRFHTRPQVLVAKPAVGLEDPFQWQEAGCAWDPQISPSLPTPHQ